MVAYMAVFFSLLFISLATAFRPRLGLSPFKRIPLQLKVVKHKVTIQHEGKDTILEVSENCTVLEAALDAGISLPYDCKLGVCLTCPSRLVSGKIDQSGSTLDDSVMEKGFALTCCAYPRSDVVIKSIEEDELVSAQFSGRITE